MSLSPDKKEQVPYDYPQFLREYKPLVEKNLPVFLDSEFARIEKDYPFASDLLPNLRRYVERDGKRIRPSLVLLSYKAYGGEDVNSAMLPALASEMMHDSFIIHDDLYDDIPGVATTRRGEEVLHSSYERDFRARTHQNDSNWEPTSFAKHAAIASAHVLLMLGSKAITDSEFDAATKLKALSLFRDTVERTWLGQGMDILSKGRPIEEVSDDEIIQTEGSRAGHYTIEFPLLLGAILAGANDEEFEKLSTYGSLVGLAFEVHDDVLGLFGQEGSIGKIQADLAEGKRTLLIHGALHGKVNLAEELLEILQNRDPDIKLIERARAIIIESGALELTQRFTSTLTSEAIKVVDDLDIDMKDRESLKQLARFVSSRRK